MPVDWDSDRERQHGTIQNFCCQCQCVMLPQYWVGRLHDTGKNNMTNMVTEEVVTVVAAAFIEEFTHHKSLFSKTPECS